MNGRIFGTVNLDLDEDFTDFAPVMVTSDWPADDIGVVVLHIYDPDHPERGVERTVNLVPREARALAKLVNRAAKLVEAGEV